MNRKSASQGFTLIELIVVIALLGTLAGVTAPVYTGYIRRSRAESCRVTRQEIADSYTRYLTENAKLYLSGSRQGGKNPAQISRAARDNARKTALDEAIRQTAQDQNAEVRLPSGADTGTDLPEAYVFCKNGGVYTYSYDDSNGIIISCPECDKDESGNVDAAKAVASTGAHIIAVSGNPDITDTASEDDAGLISEEGSYENESTSGQKDPDQPDNPDTPDRPDTPEPGADIPSVDMSVLYEQVFQYMKSNGRQPAHGNNIAGYDNNSRRITVYKYDSGLYFISMQDPSNPQFPSIVNMQTGETDIKDYEDFISACLSVNALRRIDTSTVYTSEGNSWTQQDFDNLRNAVSSDKRIGTLAFGTDGQLYAAIKNQWNNWPSDVPGRGGDNWALIVNPTQ